MESLLSNGGYVYIIAGGMHVKCKVTDICGSCYTGFIIQLKQELHNGKLRECNPLENVVLPQANVSGQSEQFNCGKERVFGEKRCNKQCDDCLKEYGSN